MLLINILFMLQFLVQLIIIVF